VTPCKKQQSREISFSTMLQIIVVTLLIHVKTFLVTTTQSDGEGGSRRKERD